MNIHQLVETTSPKAASVKYKRRWLALRSGSMQLSDDKDRTWIFCDGSTTGWHAAVVVDPGRRIRKLARFESPVSIANVGAELNGLLLGLEGGWEVRVPSVRQRVDAAMKLIEKKNLDIRFIHHGGHQKDHSDFTRWNCVADKLCGDKQACDIVTEWDDRPS